jgi:hypothetical protein
VIIGLRIDCAELEIVFRQKGLPVDTLTHIAFIPFFYCFWGAEITAELCLWALWKGIKIKDEGFQILRAFLQLPGLLIAAGYVMKHADNDVLLDGFTAARSVLQYLLSFVQIYKRLLRTFDVDTLSSIIVELNDAF